MRTRRSMTRSLAAALCALICLSVPSPAAPPARRAKYVFLMIGDGMGAAQRTAAELYQSSLGRKGEKIVLKKLVMNTFPVHGLTTTHAYSRIVTDSAAAGTAIACGAKTRYGVVAMDSSRTRDLPTIAEMAKARGMKVGIVTSVSIDHATPACFFAHAKSRSKYFDIAMQLAGSDFDYFGGGAAKGAQPARIKGDRSPITAAIANGFTIVTRREGLNALKPGCGKVWAYNHTTDRNAALYYEMDRPPDHVSLAEFTRKGIELLDNPKGFFMMVEGGRIDWACHSNDAAATIHDVLAFDRAVAEAIKFLRRRPKDTLIIVTADHECGGMALSGTRYADFAERIRRQKTSCFAFGRQVAEFRADETPFLEALPKIREAFGLERLSAYDRYELSVAYALGVEGTRLRRHGEAAPARRRRRDPLRIQCARLASRQAGISWASRSHTAVPVPTSAVGVGQELFGGYYDNTDIFRKMAKAMGLEAALAGQ